MRVTALALIVLVGCAGDTGEIGDVGVTPDVSEPALTNGARVLARAEVRGDLSGPRLQVIDADRAGDRIAVLVADGVPGYVRGNTLYSSEDAGATFSARELPDTTTEPFDGVVVTAERVVVLQPTSTSQVAAFEVGADGGLGVAEPIGAAPVYASGSVVTSAVVLSGKLEHVRYDVTDGSRTTRSIPLPAGNCEWRFAPIVLEDGSAGLQRFCYTTDERCVDTVRGEVHERTCVPLARWPIPQRLRQVQASVASGLWMLFYRDGHTFALPAVGGTGHDLGAGRPGGVTPGGVHRAFGDLLSLQAGLGASGGPRFVHLAADGTTHDYGFAASPCVDPTACQSTLVRVIASNAIGSEGFALWVVRVGDHDLLIGGDVVAGPGLAISEGGQPEVRAPRETVISQTPLELACARAISCFPGAFTLPDCVEVFLEASGAEPTTDAPLARFVAAAELGCEAFQEAAPSLFPPYEAVPGCASACVGDAAINCFLPTTPPGVVDCAREGSECRVTDQGYAACGDAALSTCGTCDGARAVTCAEGDAVFVADCGALGLGCGIPTELGRPVCTPGEAPLGWSCADGVATRAASNGLVMEREVCARIDLGCVGGRCAAGLRDEATCSDTATSSCEGDRLLWCARGERRVVDCPALGYTSCAVVSQYGHHDRARCVP